MSFDQFMSIIPLFERIESSSVSQTIACPEGCHMLLVVMRGHITVSSEQLGPTVVNQGFACHPRHAPYTIQVPRTKEAEYAVILYRVFPSASDWSLHGPLRTVSEVKIIYMLDELFRTIHEIDIHTDNDERVQQVRKRLIMERILFIYLYESQIRQEAVSSSSLSIEESLSYMNEHYMLKLTLPMLAERAGMSIGHYTVLFKQHTGKTMTRYLLELRIDKAKQMFQQTHLSAKEVAQRVGFNDYFHFSRMFKQQTGHSPTAYKSSLGEI
ncbi:MAG: AraC family transcriptional regulator [Paenibacillus sp.]|nr:AraC family transcriptional regulator [Paenibacillus sp.]